MLFCLYDRVFWLSLIQTWYGWHGMEGMIWRRCYGYSASPLLLNFWMFSKIFNSWALFVDLLCKRVRACWCMSSNNQMYGRLIERSSCPFLLDERNRRNRLAEYHVITVMSNTMLCSQLYFFPITIVKMFSPFIDNASLLRKTLLRFAVFYAYASFIAWIFIIIE